MKTLTCTLLLGMLIQPAAAGWKFDHKTSIGPAQRPGVFHHLEGAGRKHIAVSDGTIAAIWEDDHSSDPQVFVAIKNPRDQQFSAMQMVSSGEEAYEPAITALGKRRFALAWEQDGAVYMRSFSNGQAGKPLLLSEHSASHVSLASSGEDFYAVWRQQQQRNWRLIVARLKINDTGTLSLLTRHPLEDRQYQHPVLYPSIAANSSGIMLAWEDRESGHTRLKYSFSDDKAGSFSSPQNLNEFFSNRNQYDKGSGVTRVSLAPFGEDEFIAAWMDKRRGGVGYGIYTAIGSEGSFGPNEKAHGEKGDQLPHYNPSTAGNRAGKFAVAWDDFRMGNADVWITTYNEDDEWSEDQSPAVASGSGEQAYPSIALDEHNNLHLIWLQRSSPDAPTRLWYSKGRFD